MMDLLIDKIVAFGVRKIHFVEKQMHQQRVTVWCGFWSGGIIGPFFENAPGQAITVNGVRYRDMIIQFFVPKLLLLWTTRGFNKTVPYAIQPEK